MLILEMQTSSMILVQTPRPKIMDEVMDFVSRPPKTSKYP